MARQRSAALLSCAVALCAASAAARAGDRAAERRFLFDGAFFTNAGLRVSFSRPTPSSDRLGAPVAPNMPRFAPTRLIAPVPAEETIRPTQDLLEILGSGLDHDGVTPLLLLRQDQAGVLDAFTVAGADLLNAEATGAGRNRTALRGPWPRTDLLRGAVPGKTYNPRAAAVAHGLILTLCEVEREVSPGVWRPVAVALVGSQDRGVTWTLHHEDAEDQPGRPRVRTWSLANWWPLTRDPAPTEAWFAAADYRYRQPGGLEDSNGGRVLLCRAVRAAPGQPWTVEPALPVIVSANGEGEHSHAAAVAPFGPGGLRVLAAFGDGRRFSRIASATRADRDYLAPGWSVRDDFHGSLGTAGYQFVGLAPGATPRDIILGCDEEGDRLHVLTVDDDANSRAFPRLLDGQGFEAGLGSRVFHVRTPTPERAGPYAAAFEAGLNQFINESQRTLYSPDGARWAEVAAPRRPHTAAVHGEHVYIDSAAYFGVGLTRVALPQTRALRPILVSPGAVNRMPADPPAPLPGDTGNAMRPLTPAERAALDPKPPTDGPVYLVEATPAGSALLGQWRLTGAATVPAGRVHVRAWVRPAQAESAGFGWSVGDGVTETSARFVAARVARDAWSPLSMRAWFQPLSGAGAYAPRVRLYKALNDVFSMHVAFDAVVPGPQFPAQPLAPASTTPNEVLAVSGFACAAQWTVTLAGELPDEAWDDTTEFPARWPLATLRGDAGNAVELLADTAGSALEARVTRDGALAGTIRVPGVFWLRGSQLRVCVSSDGASTHLTASVGQSAPASASLSAALAVGPREIRFSSPDQSSVAAMAWHGGAVREAEFLGAVQRDAVLRSLDFLDVPAPRAGDANADGRVDFLDLNLVLADYSLRGFGLGSDLNRDGAVTLADLAAVLGNFGAAP